MLFLTLDRAERLAASGQIGGLVVTDDDLREGGAAVLAVLQARHPEVFRVVYLPAAAIPRLVQELCRSRCDAVLVRGIDDHPKQVRDIFDGASRSSVAAVVEHASRPAPALLAAGNLLGPL